MNARAERRTALRFSVRLTYRERIPATQDAADRRGASARYHDALTLKVCCLRNEKREVRMFLDFFRNRYQTTALKGSSSLVLGQEFGKPCIWFEFGLAEFEIGFAILFEFGFLQNQTQTQKSKPNLKIQTHKTKLKLTNPNSNLQ